MKRSLKGSFALIFLLSTLCFAFLSPFNYSEPVYAQENLSHAKSMIVIERDSLRPLYSYNSQEKLPMASTTKIITAIFCIEKNQDIDRVIKIPKSVVGIEGTSIGLKEGEHLTIRELLYGLMLRSGNDSAEALAIATSGSLENFKKEINHYLKEKGCNSTNLENPHGLPNDNHYTTASDLAKITAYALKNETFKEIVSTEQKTISNELKTKTSRDMLNKNKLLRNYEYADGVKTGYTRKAGRCFVGSATKDGMQLICVLLNCGPMFEDCQFLLDKGFNEFKLYKILSKGDKVGTVNVSKSNTTSIDLICTNDFYYPLKREELKGIKMNVKCDNDVVAPLKERQEIGEVEITLENQLIFSDKIYSINGVKPNTFSSEFQRVVERM